MNISSVVITIVPGQLQEVLDKLKLFCEVHHFEGNKIIATIEGESIDNEIKAVRDIEKIDGISNVEMAFSYSEIELEKIRNDVEIQDDVPEWLNDESVTAKQIDYQGDLKKKL